LHPTTGIVRRYSLVHLLSGLLLMLSASYLDNVRGVILPVITRQLKINYADGSWFLVAGNWAAMVFTLCLLPLVKKVGDRRLALMASTLAVVVVSLAGQISSFHSLLVFAFVLGGSIAAMGTISNLLTMNGASPDILSRTLSGMHVMYGVGSLLAPLVTAPMLARGMPWPLVVLAPLPLLGGVIFLNFKVTRPAGESRGDQKSHESGPGRSQAGLQLLLLSGFGAYVCGEVLVSMWMTTYLVEFRGMTIEAAAPYLIGFFAVMAVSRFGCFLLASERLVKPLIYFSLTVPVMFFLLGHLGFHWAFSAVGFVGPFFPLFMARITGTFPRAWRRLTILSIVTMQICLGAAHFGLGHLVDVVGAQRAFLTPIFFLLLTLGVVLTYFRREKAVLAGLSSLAGSPAGNSLQ